MYEEIFRALSIRSQDLSRIFLKYGERSQSIKAIEEMAELQQVLAKRVVSAPDALMDKMVEETADVLVVLFQLILFKIPCNKIAEMIDEKISRQIGRMQNEEPGSCQ